MFRSLTLAACLALSATGALANTEPTLPPQVAVVRSLTDLGYSIVSQGRTWLGRYWILAEKDGIRREIVIDPRTGEILRDYAAALLPEKDKERSVASSGEGNSLPEVLATGAVEPPVVNSDELILNPPLLSSPTD
jgi:hypothetical protein